MKDSVPRYLMPEAGLRGSAVVHVEDDPSLGIHFSDCLQSDNRNRSGGRNVGIALT
jgi:hypothetical protein